MRELSLAVADGAKTQRRLEIQDVMYLSIAHAFNAVGVPLAPDASHYRGRGLRASPDPRRHREKVRRLLREILPDGAEAPLEDFVREILVVADDPRASGRVGAAGLPALTLASVYGASARFGYFLSVASERLALERALGDAGASFSSFAPVPVRPRSFARRAPILVSHWSPYDRVRDARADPRITPVPVRPRSRRARRSLRTFLLSRRVRLDACLSTPSAADAPLHAAPTYVCRFARTTTRIRRFVGRAGGRTDRFGFVEGRGRRVPLGVVVRGRGRGRGRGGRRRGGLVDAVGRARVRPHRRLGLGRGRRGVRRAGVGVFRTPATPRRRRRERRARGARRRSPCGETAP